MNYWGEPYPDSMSDLIAKCESSIRQNITRLNRADCRHNGIALRHTEHHG